MSRVPLPAKYWKCPTILYEMTAKKIALIIATRVITSIMTASSCRNMLTCVSPKRKVKLSGNNCINVFKKVSVHGYGCTHCVCDLAIPSGRPAKREVAGQSRFIRTVLLKPCSHRGVYPT